MQGGMTVRALREKGFAICALVRDPSSEAAKKLEKQGVVLFKGDLDDRESIDRAVNGAIGVFSVQMPAGGDDEQSEIRMGQNLIAAAYNAAVEIFVHTSVARAGDQNNFVGWDEGRWALMKSYWEGKSGVIDAVVAKGFRRYTILKPAWFMDNFATPRSTWMLPKLQSEGVVETGLLPDTKRDLIAAEDIGKFAAAAFADPDRFHAAHIDLATESLTADECAKTISLLLGQSVTTRSLTEEEMDEHHYHPGIRDSWVWDNVEGYKVDIERTKSWGVPLQTFESWARANQPSISIGRQDESSKA